MKQFIAIIAMVFPLVASALDLELSVGSTKFSQTDNSIWYQNGFHHTLDLQSASYSFGVSDYLWRNVRWRVEAGRLGQVSTEAQAVSDANYNGVDGCRHPCETPVTVRTEGSIRGISFTLAPEFTVMGVKAFIEAGAFVFWPSFSAGVSESPNTHMSWGLHYKEGPQVGAQLGGGVQVKNTQLVFTAYNVDTKVSNPDAITSWKGMAYNVKIRQLF